MSRVCKLQINTAGAWRDVLKFDIDQVDDVAVQQAAAQLVMASGPMTCTTLRICIADSLNTALARWTPEKGWVPA